MQNAFVQDDIKPWHFLSEKRPCLEDTPEVCEFLSGKTNRKQLLISSHSLRGRGNYLKLLDS